MLGFLRKKTPEDRFWKWFTLNSHRLFHFETDQEQVFDELSRQLAQLNERLCFELGPVKDGRREFIISADGDKSAFPAVRALVAAAPPYPEWVIIPFRPPMNLDDYSEVAYGDVTLSVDDVWFSYEKDETLVHLDLYIPGYEAGNEGKLGSAAYLLLDLALGEYVVETQVGGIARHALPADPAGQGLRPLREITTIVTLPVQ